VSVDAFVRRDRWISAAGLIAIIALSWLYLLDMARTMGSMSMPDGSRMSMPIPEAWTNSCSCSPCGLS
jgi:hypothetical protein